MAATLSRIVFNQATGDEQMIVHPDTDSQLADPAFGPANSFWADVPRPDYLACKTVREKLALVLPTLSAKRPILGELITQRVALIDAFAALDSDRDLLNTRLDNWPNPTPAQQLLINAAKAKIVQDLSDIQTIRGTIQTILGQL